MPDGQEIMVTYQRRERFTFKPKHLEVLESCFKDNPYPSYEQRETIANMCNQACSNNGEMCSVLFSELLPLQFYTNGLRCWNETYEKP